MRIALSRVSRVSVWIACFAFSGSVASAATEIRFEAKELEAAWTLVKPVESFVSLDGTKGVFTPGPRLRFAGVPELDFDIDLGLGGDLADVRFNELRSRDLIVAFESGRIRVEIPLEDRKKAIRSAIGAIHIRETSLVGWFRPVESANGSIALAIESCEIRGELKGTGLLVGPVVKKIRSALAKVLKKQMARLLGKPGVRDGIEKGLVKYAQFSVDERLERYVPGSIALSSQGIFYQAE